MDAQELRERAREMAHRAHEALRKKDTAAVIVALGGPIGPGHQLTVRDVVEASQTFDREFNRITAELN